MADFIHLHNHSDYSLQDGAFKVSNLVRAAIENKMEAVALTEHGNMFSAIHFYKEAKRNGIKPIIGMEAYVSYGGDRFSRPLYQEGDNRKQPKPYNHLVLLCKNQIGYKNLSKLSSLGYIEGFYYRPRIDLELLKKYSEGLVCLSACPAGVVAYHLVAGNMEKAREVAITYKEIFGDDFYLEIQNHNIEKEKWILEGMPILSKELGIKLVATNDCHYHKQSEAIAHNVLLNISKQRGSIDYKQLRYETDQLYFKSAEEMIKLFKHYPGAIENTLEIAEKCNLELDLNRNYFPNYPIPPDSGLNSLDDYMEKLAYEGLKKKIGNFDEVYKNRLDYELSVIKKMGYSGYFLIVQDFIRAAKEKDIAVGPGRGSAAGSLVSYALDITDVDPLKYDLLFERFLNPDRISMPDIDCDFADDKREEIINYVKEKYGEENVAQIVTYNRLSSKAILKDVGRVLGMKISDVNAITKHIPVEFGKVLSIDKSIEEVPELHHLKNIDDPILKELIDYSRVLENMNRNVSKHAAGVVISPEPLIEMVPLYYQKETGLITQYSMKDLESIGLLKMDFLGLRTLTIIKDTIRLIKENYNVEIDISKIPLDDEKTYELFSQGRTVGVFQFDKKHTQDFLKRLKPKNILELSAMNALNRPGPMDFIPEFIDRKHGKKEIKYLHPKLEPILKETYGIIVYQEQVIKIAHDIIGYSLSKADLMRRAMGKKDKDLMEALGKEFIEEGVKHGIQEGICKKIWEEIKQFANYGFNKSHSVAYSILAYQTAYLKAHYPVEFLTASLCNNINKTDELSLFLSECRKFKIPILPPDVNESDVSFKIENKNSIRFGLAAIKNVGTSAVENIIKVRKEKRFVSIFDFCSRVDSRIFNKRALEGLIVAGAFDNIHPNRAELFDTVEIAMSYGQKKKSDMEKGQSSLFEMFSDTLEQIEPKIIKRDEWSNMEKMQKEKASLGFFCSAHPLDDYDLYVRSFTNVDLTDQEYFEKERSVILCAVLTDIETKIYQENKTLAKFTALDIATQCDAIMFDNEFKKYKDYLKEYAIVVLKGIAELKGDSIQLKVSEIIPIEKAISILGNGILIDLKKENNIELLEKLKNILSKFKGDKPFIINLINGDGKSYQYKLKHYTVKLEPNLIKSLKEIIPEENIWILK